MRSIRRALLLGLPVVFLLAASSGVWTRAEPGPDPGPRNTFQETEAEKAKKKYAFVGVKGCKKCHMKQTGDQYRIWKKAPHAKAYETLKTDLAKKMAADAGVGDPTKAHDCLRCHVTGHGLDAKLVKKIKPENGVGCESCHGPGEKYVDKAIHFDRPTALKNGFQLIEEKTCLQCHNPESPSYKPFVYAEKIKKIHHPIPPDKLKKLREKRAAEKKE